MIEIFQKIYILPGIVLGTTACEAMSLPLRHSSGLLVNMLLTFEYQIILTRGKCDIQGYVGKTIKREKTKQFFHLQLRVSHKFKSFSPFGSRCLL